MRVLGPRRSVVTGTPSRKVAEEIPYERKVTRFVATRSVTFATGHSIYWSQVTATNDISSYTNSVDVVLVPSGLPVNLRIESTRSCLRRRISP